MPICHASRQPRKTIFSKAERIGTVEPPVPPTAAPSVVARDSSSSSHWNMDQCIHRWCPMSPWCNCSKNKGVNSSGGNAMNARLLGSTTTEGLEQSIEAQQTKRFPRAYKVYSTYQTFNSLLSYNYFALCRIRGKRRPLLTRTGSNNVEHPK